MRIYLRPITIDDGKMIVKWRNSNKILNHCFDKKKITEKDNKNFFENNIMNGNYLQFIVERVEENSGVASYPIATVYLKDIDRVNRRCELCVFTSDDEEWNAESQSIAIKMLIKKAFDELKMHKIYSYVFYEFLDEADLLKKAGFKPESILREENLCANGTFGDVVRFGIINDKGN